LSWLWGYLTTTFWTFSTIGWNDLADILILSYLIYRALLVLQDSRAFQSLIGLVFLLLLYALAARFQLYTLRWLLEKISVYIVLAVVILFQQDIRQGLARAGGKLFRSFAPRIEASLIEEVIRASFSLAARRMGALIVLQRSGSLDGYTEGAHRLDSVVSHDLLLSVFHPTSPLHDGAVIIANSRIAAAKVILPLSVSKDVGRFFGTRHRAGIGLTEETDAVVLIVSEERGLVSLAMAGALTPVSDPNELRQRLQEILTNAPSSADPVPVPKEA
jgi:diadenylate cyclase